ERHGLDHPPERRLVERAETSAQPVWKLFTTGSVGSQVLLGLLALERLRRDPDLGADIAVWPLETGLQTPVRPIVLSEIYPSMIPPDPSETIKDAGQVKAAVAAYARLDAQAALPVLFQGPCNLSPAERRIVAEQEGWILGAGAQDWLRHGRRAEEPVPSPNATHQALHLGPGLAEDPAPYPIAEPRPGDNLHKLTYLRDPAAIYSESFSTVRAEARLDHLPADLIEVAIRLVHACGMPEITARLAWSPGLAAAARQALDSGRPVLCDCQAVASGVVRARLPAQNEVLCTLADHQVPALAKTIGNTRSAAAVELWHDHLEGAVVAVGNAPTALFHLLELIDAGWPKPAAILGFPVGFVGAAESKSELAARPRGVDYLVLRGRKGGSAMAAAAVNALAAGLEAPQ
ncbi:MAG: precorrin-8X methylmutase, partial [Pseudomonadota bacterium]